MVSIRIGLWLDLKIYSLLEPKILIEEVKQELGYEEMTKEDIRRNQNGNNLLNSFSL
jgi:hypothetical protein